MDLVRAPALALLLVAVLCSPAARTQTIERPEWVPGDTWTWRRVEGPVLDNPTRETFDVTVRVSEVRPARYKLDYVRTSHFGDRTPSSGTWWLTRDLNGYFREDASIPFTEIKFLRWPLAVGSTWSFEVPSPRAGRPFVWRMRVVRQTRVTVPAGEFDAWLIEGSGVHEGGGVYEERTTLWYAPEAKRVVRAEGYGRVSRGASLFAKRVSEELVSFSLAPRF
jgi:hypothetical protein